MGFTIYLCHTQPSVPWFCDRKEWIGYEAQLQSPVHVSFPVPFSRVFHNILEHAAHHVDINVWLYQLTEARRTLDKLHPQNVVSDKWPVGSFISLKANLQVVRLSDPLLGGFSRQGYCRRELEADKLTRMGKLIRNAPVIRLGLAEGRSGGKLERVQRCATISAGRRLGAGAKRMA